MTVRELMARPPVTVVAETPLSEARSLMRRMRIRHLLVTQADRLVGMVTDRDIRLNLPSKATSLSVWELTYLIERLTVRDAMQTSLIVVEPERDAVDAARIMLDHKIGALPVVDGQRLVGLVTESDFVRAFVDRFERAMVAAAR